MGPKLPSTWTDGRIINWHRTRTFLSLRITTWSKFFNHAWIVFRWTALCAATPSLNTSEHQCRRRTRGGDLTKTGPSRASCRPLTCFNPPLHPALIGAVFASPHCTSAGTCARCPAHAGLVGAQPPCLRNERKCRSKIWPRRRLGGSAPMASRRLRGFVKVQR